jgi:hypothetical protein
MYGYTHEAHDQHGEPEGDKHLSLPLGWAGHTCPEDASVLDTDDVLDAHEMLGGPSRRVRLGALFA